MPGTISRKISMRFCTRSDSRSATPVALPPGRGKLFTNRPPSRARGLAVQRQSPDGLGVRAVVDREHAFHAGDDLAEDLHALLYEVRFEIGDPRGVAAGPGEAFHQSPSHRVARAHEDDRNPMARR